MAETPTPNQRRAATALSGSLCVSAGAGSGKTRVLVERFLEAQRRGADVESVLTLTFTEKAAKEMKERIAASLEAAGEVGKRRRIDGSFVSTIHSFCMRLLREHAFSIDIDPEFQVVTAVDAALFFDEAFESLFESGGDGFANLCLSIKEDRLRGNLRHYIAHQRSLGRSADDLEAMAGDAGCIPRLLASLDERLLRRLAEELAPVREAFAAERLSKKSEEKRTAVLDILSRIGEFDSAPLLCEKLKEARKYGKGNIFTLLKNALEPYEKIPASPAAAEKDGVALKAAFLGAAAGLWRRYDALKRERSLLDFDDLQDRAKRLLEGDGKLREELRSRFTHLMIDEGQDTNALQLALVETLARDNLFMVGDVKQSIYGFRNADVELFRRFRERHQSIPLSENFRSRRELISFVNALFAGLLPGYEPLQYAAGYEAMGFTRDYAGPRVDVITTDGATLEIARAAEAAMLAARVRELVEGEAFDIFDRDAHETRPVRYRDIAVLVPTRSNLDTYTEALDEAGVPFFTVEAGSFFQKREVLDLLDFLGIVDNPRDNLKFAAVLKSPLVELSDTALFLLRRGKEKEDPLYDALAGFEEIHGIPKDDAAKLKSFRSFFTELRETAFTRDIVGLLIEALEFSQFEAKLLSGWLPKIRTANVRKLLGYARAFRESGHTNLREFLSYMRDVSIAEERRSERAGGAEGEDLVRIMTIHAAKGLEFPVVALADMGHDFARADRSGFYVAESVPCFNYRGLDGEDVKLASTSIAGLLQKAKETEEKKRHLYVAMTRAREHLILAGSTAKGRACGFLEWVGDFLAAHDTAVMVHIVAPAETTAADAPARKTRPRAPKPSSGDRKWAEETFRALGKPRPLHEPGRDFSVTSLVDFMNCPFRYYLRHVLKLPYPDTTGAARGADDRRPAYEIGNLIHKAFEVVAFEPGTFLGGVEKFLEGKDLTAGDFKRCMKMADAFRASDMFGELAGAARVMKEVPVLHRVGNSCIRGQVDCIAFADGRVRILDYKSNEVTAANTADTASAYRPQLELYALLLAESGLVTDAGAIEAGLFFLHPGLYEPVVTGGTALADVREKIGRAIEKILSDEIFQPPSQTARCTSCRWKSYGICEGFIER